MQQVQRNGLMIFFLVTGFINWPLFSSPPAFVIKRAVFINRSTEQFDEFALKSNNLFKEGDHLSIYLEPQNCTLKKVSEGLKAQIGTKAVLSSVSNPNLSQNIDLGILVFVIPSEQMNLYADITFLDVGKLPIDLYKLEVEVVDIFSHQQNIFTRQFRVGPSYIQAVVTPNDVAPAVYESRDAPIFAPASPRIYCHFKTRRIPVKSILRANCIAECAENYQDEHVVASKTMEITRFEKYQFYFDSPKTGWNKGVYRVELRVNKVFEIAVYFRVK